MQAVTGDQHHQRRQDGTDSEPVGLLIVCGLAGLAGAVDACGLSILHDLYVSFMSGNSTSMGMAIAVGRWSRALLIAELLAGFVGGAAAGTVLARFAGRYRLPVVLCAVVPLVAVPALTRHGAGPALSTGMGMLNTAMQHAGSTAVSVTYVTGTLVKLGRGLGELLCGRSKDWSWLVQAVPWVGLLGGATAAGLALDAYGDAVFLVLPPAFLLAALVTLVAIPSR